jgi:hypothetical protein
VRRLAGPGRRRDIGQLVPEARLRIVLQAITTPRSLRHFGLDLTGIELRASDIDWSFGSGAPLSGPARDLALALCDRKLPAGRLRGAPVGRFTVGQTSSARASPPAGSGGQGPDVTA